MPQNALLVLTQLFEDFSTSFSIGREGKKEKEIENRKMVRKYSDHRGFTYPQFFFLNCNCLWIHMVSRGWRKMYFIKVLKPILNEVDVLHMCVRMHQVNHCVLDSLSKVNDTN